MLYLLCSSDDTRTGGRGGRGARGGGAGSAGRGGSRANGDSYIGGGGYGKSNGDTTATTTAATWGDAVTTDTSASWADDTPSAVDAPSTDNAGADWGDEPKAEATGGDAGWGAEPAATSTEASSRAGWGDAAPAKASVPRAAAVKMPTKPKLIQPGSKISWAQIAKCAHFLSCSTLSFFKAMHRPAEPPKPAPPPPAMVEQPPPAQAEPPVPVVDIPSENVVEQIAAATSHNVDPWASTPAAATEPWEARPIGGVGEGWAETVLAADSEPSSDVSAPGPAAGVDPAGPLEVTPGVQDQPSHPITANLEAQAAQQHPQEAVNKPLSSVIGPPGLTKRGSQRNHQDAAVVMPNDLRSPGSGALEHANMQFGSLALFDSRTVAGEHLQQEDTTGKIEQEAPQTQPHRPQESRCVFSPALGVFLRFSDLRIATPRRPLRKSWRPSSGPAPTSISRCKKRHRLVLPVNKLLLSKRLSSTKRLSNSIPTAPTLTTATKTLTRLTMRRPTLPSAATATTVNLSNSSNRLRLSKLPLSPNSLLTPRPVLMRRRPTSRLGRRKTTAPLRLSSRRARCRTASAVRRCV